MKRPDPSGRSPAPLRYAGFGLQLAATMVVFVLLGSWADGKAGTDGLFTILGALLGFGGSFYSLFRQLKRDNQDNA